MRIWMDVTRQSRSGMRFNILILEKLANLVRMDLNSFHTPSQPAMAEDAVGLHEIRKYKIIRDSQQYSNGLSPFQFWKNFSRQMPELSQLAIMTLLIPASSAEVERSFSLLRRILTAQRTRFTEEN
ncbi:unnamed protein product [Orchesella dallaii]|uniref:HAT C-terminal dimerisation domain-containing protein n=1 Tax=Orchesella dallaii TaxID=48710 RepID=A0ABP1QZJ2_9HEXA